MFIMDNEMIMMVMKLMVIIMYDEMRIIMDDELMVIIIYDEDEDADYYYGI